jgi:hypothetical protein
MKPADLDRASAAVAASLEQLSGALDPTDALGAASAGFGLGPERAYAFDACKESAQPAATGGDTEVLVAQMKTSLHATPMPGRGAGDAHLPRFREELGPFIGIFGSLGAGVAWGGVVSPSARASSGVGAGVRVGYGAESVTGTPGTATNFLELGIDVLPAQVSHCSGPACASIGSSNLFPDVPARVGLRLGLRLPFWLIPGDMLVLAPTLALTSPRTLSSVGVAAASGGLIPYERTLQTDLGTFQIVLGREVQATLFGYLGDANVPLYVAPIATRPDGTKEWGVVAGKSIGLVFPVVEWTPFRAFATQLAFTVNVQLGFGVELPLETHVVFPADRAAPSVPAVWTIFLRGQFDGRYFIGTREDLQPSGH